MTELDISHEDHSSRRDDPFWKEDPSILYNKNKLVEFVPNRSMSFNRRLNAMTRFLIYFTVLLLVFYGHIEVVFLLLAGLVLIYYMYENKMDVNLNVDKSGVSFKLEPFSSHVSNPDRKDHDKPKSKKEVKEKFCANIAPEPNMTYVPESDSLLPDGLFNEDTSKYKVNLNDIHIRYADNEEPTSQIYANERPQGASDMEPEGVSDRSDVVPSSSFTLASVDAVRDAFKKPETFGKGQESIAFNGDCTKCSAPTTTKMCPQQNNPSCQMPTVNNPFMNVMVTDYGNNPNRPPACDQQVVQNDIDNKWSNNLYRNVNDVWDKTNGQQSYETQNWTTIPNDRDAFQKWLFTIPYVCKDGTDPEVCYRGAELQMAQMRPGKIF